MDCTSADFPKDIDAVAHLAASPSVSMSWLRPRFAHTNNLSTTVQVIELCCALGIKRLVFASSAAVYGNASRLPVCEHSSMAPLSPYAFQKAASETYGRLFAARRELSFIALRLFNVYGPGQSPLSPYSGVITAFFSSIQRGEPLTIHSDGRQTRDFISVKDFAHAFHKALTFRWDRGRFVAFDVATGISTSVVSLAHAIRSLYPLWSGRIDYVSKRSDTVEHSQGDISKARELLEFTASCSLRDGLQETATAWSANSVVLR
jgi:UDP-glucose 4-epimerase